MWGMQGGLDDAMDDLAYEAQKVDDSRHEYALVVFDRATLLPPDSVISY